MSAGSGFWRGTGTGARQQCADWLSVWNTGLRILDAMMHPVPPGGREISISPVFNWRRGILDDPSDRQPLYCRSFCPWRTDVPYGDVARWLDNGAVEYLGRSDVS